MFANALQTRRVIVVGYNNTDTTLAGDDYRPFTSSFINIAEGAKNKFNLCDLKVARDGSGSAYYIGGTVSLQILNGNGTTKKTYYWFYNRTHGEKSGVEGWYTDALGTASNLVTPETGITFKAGDGFWFKGDRKLVTSSGAVLTATQVEVDTTAAGDDYLMLANPYPVAIDLADITVMREGTGSAYYIGGTVSAQVLNGNGTTKKTYYWFYNRTHGEKSGVEGWYTDALGTAANIITKESNIKLQPNDAYWFKGDRKTIKFPALNLN